MPDDRPVLSIVAPVFRSDAIVPEYVRRTCESAVTITEDFELLLVEDGSPDGSWAAIVRECAREPRVRGVQLSRNFGTS
jgi:polyisoprenyl-phosphate glycosyltransferase